MSQDDDITRIEDLPDVDRSQEEESGFTSLEDMAKDLGIQNSPPEGMPDLPGTEELTADNQILAEELTDLNSKPSDDYEFGENEFEQDDETSDFSEDNFYSDNPFEDESEFSTEKDANQYDYDDEDNTFLEGDNESDLDSAPLSTASDDYSEFDSSPEQIDSFDSYDIEAPTAANDLMSAPSDDFEMSDNINSPFEDDLDKKLDLLDSSEDSSDENVEISEDIDHLAHEEVNQAENFEDLKDFAENIVHEGAITAGNPPFSIILKEIKYQEDIEDILEALKEYNILQEDEEIEKAKTNLSSGQYLIPRISEYLAIHLCHKFRKFDLEILVGLTEEIHPPKSYESNDRGPITKSTLYNNKTFHLNDFVKPNQNEILTSTMNQIAGHEIKQYLGIITHRKKMNFNEVNDSKLEDTIYQNMSSDNQDRLTELRIKRENLLATHSRRIWEKDLESSSSKREENAEDKLNKIYNILIDEMKAQAVNKSANAILGINFSITPISVDQYLHQGPQYEIICSGNLAWIERNI